MADIIYKYGPFYRHQDVPFRGEPVHVGFHTDGELYLWCRIPYDPAIAPAVSEAFTPAKPRGPFTPAKPRGRARIVYTGEEYTGRYIGTVIDSTGLVLHVIEV